MADIEKVVRYVWYGKEYHDVESVRKQAENKLGELIDQLRIPCNLSAAQQIKLFDWLIKNRRSLNSLLCTTISDGDLDISIWNTI